MGEEREARKEDVVETRVGLQDMLFVDGRALLLHLVSYGEMRLLPGGRVRPAPLGTRAAPQLHSLQWRGGRPQHTVR